ncbi:MAG TPA: hypothetical protein VG929_05865 [Actinomycetota bacterium]|nr:hypothetical protein [Actinomycetota bacterium]
MSPGGYVSIDPAVMFAVGLVAAGILLLRGQEPAVDDAGRAASAERERSPLGVLTLSAAFLTVGVLILLGNLGVADITIGQLAAACLTVVGLGALVGTWWGSSRFLMVVGVVLVPFVIAGGFMHFPLRGSVGDRWLGGRSIEAVDGSHEILIGAMHVNLADMRNFEGEREIDISMAAGNATIFVPERIGLTIAGHIEWGNANIGRGRQTGDDLELNETLAGTPGAGHLTINFTGGIASLYVERISHEELYGPREKREEPERARKRNRDQTDDSRKARQRRRDRAEA